MLPAAPAGISPDAGNGGEPTSADPFLVSRGHDGVPWRTRCACHVFAAAPIWITQGSDRLGLWAPRKPH
jgi:hypothetical protein